LAKPCSNTIAEVADVAEHGLDRSETELCLGRTVRPQRLEPNDTLYSVEVEDLSSVTIRFEHDAIGNCSASWVRRKHEEVPQFEIDGEDASLYFSINRVWSQTQKETLLFATMLARSRQIQSPIRKQLTSSCATHSDWSSNSFWRPLCAISQPRLTGQSVRTSSPATGLHFSHALLGIFDAIAPAAAAALAALDIGHRARYEAILAPTTPLARYNFKTPTRFYKTGVVSSRH
jgi:hypothetical protein